MEPTIHHVFVVTSQNFKSAMQAHTDACRVFGEAAVSVPITSTYGHVTFLAGPDGAPEGTEQAIKGAADRAAFRVLLQGIGDLSWVESRYGPQRKRRAARAC